MRLEAIIAALALLSGCPTNPEPNCFGETEYTTTILGGGLDAYNGRHVYAMTLSDQTCRGEGNAQVIAGRIELTMINLADEDVYPEVAAFIDLDDDGHCGGGDIGDDWDATRIGTIVETQLRFDTLDIAPCHRF